LEKKLYKQKRHTALGLWRVGEFTPRGGFFNECLTAVASVCLSRKQVDGTFSLLAEKGRFDMLMLALGPDSKQHVQEIFVCDRAFCNNQNMVLAVYTTVKLESMIALEEKRDFAMKRLYSSTRWALLLRKLITIFKTVFACIFGLSQQLFGKKYTFKKNTTRKAHGVTYKCHNYVCDMVALGVFVQLANWSKCILADFEPAIVSEFNLADCQPHSTSTHTVSDKTVVLLDKEDFFNPHVAPSIALTGQNVLVSKRAPKRLLCDAVGPFSSQDALQKQKLWHTAQNLQKNPDELNIDEPATISMHNTPHNNELAISKTHTHHANRVVMSPLLPLNREFKDKEGSADEHCAEISTMEQQHDTLQEDTLAQATEFLREIHTLVKQERFMAYLYQKSWEERRGSVFGGIPRKGPSWPESTFMIQYNIPDPAFWWKPDLYEKESDRTFGPSNIIFRNPNPGLFERKVQDPSSGVMWGVSKLNTRLYAYDPVTHNARLQVHRDEYSKCIAWCIKAGPEYHPAFDHNHKAPCNVNNFYYGLCPWLSNGSVSPLGVPPVPSNYPTYH